METPENFEGFLTDCIMNSITRKIGKMPQHNYDAIQAGVLEATNKWLSAIQNAKADGKSLKQFLMEGFC